MNTAAYDRLKTHLGLKTETRSFWRALQYAVLDEETMARFHSDGRPLIPGPAPSTLSRDIAPDRFVDAWGITWQPEIGMTLPALIDGTQEQVAEEVRIACNSAPVAGGLVLTCANSVMVGVKYQNYLAQLRAARRYGQKSATW
jgi:hypothetical protein